MNLERFAVLPQYLLPKHALTEFAGRVARREGGRWTTWLIETFIRRYGVDMSEALEADPSAYPTFNAFFTRALRAGARPLADGDWICPVDGAISQFGPIEDGRLVQAKGHRYSVTQLLGGDRPLAETLSNGSFATLYLAPKDYHRVHMPRAGALVSMRYVPGELFSVNPTTARGVRGLFARNERVICRFADPASREGDFVLVLVGATIVGSVETCWHGVVAPPRTPTIRTWIYPVPTQPGPFPDDEEGKAEARRAGLAPGAGAGSPVQLGRGEEMGRFALGSTVIVLMPAAAGRRFAPRWAEGESVRMGELMANDGPATRVGARPAAATAGRPISVA